MELLLLWVVVGIEALVTATLFIILPRIARRGLLFGVYVGEVRWESDEARRITRGWYAGMVLGLVAGAALAFAVALVYPGSPAGPFVSLFALVALYPFLYLRAHLQARRMAEPGAPDVMAAPLVPETPASLEWPAFAIVVGVVGGGLAIGHAALNYEALPARVPTHFGFSGAPDAWSPRSFWTVLLLPIGTLIMGVSLGVVAALTARAKRAIRRQDKGVSVEAQMRFRSAMTRFLSGVAILTTVMMALLSVGAVEVALGRAERLPPLFMALTGVLLVYALGGSLYLALRYGQGGARLERRAEAAPLTDGLADNRRWVLGLFYVNRDDPSIFVEKRFGLGYTINFGNPRAIALLLVFLALIAAFTVAGVVSSR
ncbi:MAG: DUF1648 domain-containing protein [Vicinamibacterales bacterium]